jgi:hypothetical protein
MTGAVDEHGRPISPDGFYVWDGAQWVQRQAAQVAPQQQLSPDGRHAWNGQQWVPVPQLQPATPQPQYAAAVDDGLDAEVETYDGMSRIIRPAVLEIRQHLLPGERVLASTSGSGELLVPKNIAIPAVMLVGVVGAVKRGIIVAATEQRVLLASLAVSGRSLSGVVPLRYDEIATWKAEKRSISLAATNGITARPHQLQKDKVLQVRGVVEPRLRPGVVQA